MSLLFKSSKTNKKFNYRPRYYQNNREGSPFEAKGRFEEFRAVDTGGEGLKQKFARAVADFKNNPNQRANRTVLIIALMLIFIFLWLIDFELTLFLPKK